VYPCSLTYHVGSFLHARSLARSLVRALRRNIKNYLIQAQGFNESEMLILCDDGRSHAPTKKNIEDAFRRITEYSQAGDVVFVHVRTACLITFGGSGRNAHGPSSFPSPVPVPLFFDEFLVGTSSTRATADESG
jgi:hypothetical protein